ncbi:glutathione S-transferase family protein [Lysobacter korlensis]|uniref:Glutathione S-transferase family protein n=1 Tax=Lysobacter korlensis TaxID=553636 RepID=A0ABV6RK85_9GAMM
MSEALATLVIGNKNYSSWSLRPWLLMREFGIAFREEQLALDTPGFAERIGTLSPTRRVPALHDGGLVVWDSLAICEYVNDRWLHGRGWPERVDSRALARSAAAEMHSGFAALRSQLPMNSRRTPDSYRWDAAAQADIDRVQQLWCELRKRHADEGEFLCGRFGIVDAMFAPVVIRFDGYGVQSDETCMQYMQAINALPGMREWRDAATREPEVIEGSEKRG